MKQMEKVSDRLSKKSEKRSGSKVHPWGTPLWWVNKPDPSQKKQITDGFKASKTLSNDFILLLNLSRQWSSWFNFDSLPSWGRVRWFPCEMKVVSKTSPWLSHVQGACKVIDLWLPVKRMTMFGESGWITNPAWVRRKWLLCASSVCRLTFLLSYLRIVPAG